MHEKMMAAVALQREGRLDEAVGLYEAVERANPDVLEAPYLLALIEIEQGELEGALRRLKAVLARRPGWFEARSSLAYLYEQLGRWSEAASVYRALLVDHPDRAGVVFRLAAALEVLGGLDEAMALLRGLAKRPGSRLSALVALAGLAPGSVTTDEIEAMAVVAASGRAAPIGLHFALGELLERQGRFDEAFQAFVEGNRRQRHTLIEQKEPEEREMAAPEGRRRGLPPDEAAAAHAKAARYLKTVFTGEFIAHHQAKGHHIAAPIFVVGMPRSGSTLIEQILSSHRRVQGLGECPALSKVIAGQFPMDLFAPEPPAHFRHLAESYLAAIHARGWRNTPRFVDKSLGNYQNIGMIHLMFPHAVILHAARDPMDTCLANFRKLFATGNEESYDLGDIGRDYVRYREVMDHWAAVLPGRVTEVRHEALVADPEETIRWLITEACGLPWAQACLRFHETKRPVRTASVAQVRQPIFTTSVDRWRQYEKHLGPLFEALGPYAPKR